MKRKDKNRNLKWYLGGEFCGKAAVLCTEALIVFSVLGIACELIWDFNERKQQARVLTNKNKNYNR